MLSRAIRIILATGLAAAVPCASAAESEAIALPAPFLTQADAAWRLEFDDGTQLTPTNALRKAIRSADGCEIAEYVSSSATVVVRLRKVDDGLEISGRVSKTSGTVVAFWLPDGLPFPSRQAVRLVVPQEQFGLGVAFNASFLTTNLAYSVEYPAAFCDFMHLDFADAVGWSLYGVQPRFGGEFRPAALAAEGGVGTARLRHAWRTYVRPGDSFESPPLRLRRGTYLSALDAYAKANGLGRTIEDKLRDRCLLEKLKLAPLVKLVGSVKMKTATLDHLPTPTLIHTSDHLPAGIDKYFPDHVPPGASFGTAEEYRRWIDVLHARGHLYMPYTNPTWWCDHPRGVTFSAAGEAGLLVRADGQLRRQHFGFCFIDGVKTPKDGFMCTLFHPAVKAANAKTIRDFTVDYPSDVIFQDQVGARHCELDFNPASPSPTAYSEGMIQMAESDARRVPLGTENGWDRIAESESVICGLSWNWYPPDDRKVRPSKRKLLKAVYPPQMWELEPVALRLAHANCIFMHHDLGQFVLTPQQLAWTVGMGYSLSFVCGGYDLATNAHKLNWYRYLHRIQREGVSKYLCRPLTGFRHDRRPMLERAVDPTNEADDGTIEAEYGEVRVVANLGPVPRRIGNRQIGPYGFAIEGPGFFCGDDWHPEQNKGGVKEW